jgi:peptidoglycan hydrolase CwlO-like protein
LNTTRHTWAARGRYVLAVVAAALVANPAVGFSSPGRATGPRQQGPGQSEAAGPVLDIDVDVFKAEQSEVTETLDSLTENVNEQIRQVEDARLALTEAEALLEEARQKVAETQKRIDELTARSDEVVIDAFINPPTESGIDALVAESPSEVAIKQAILNDQATVNAGVLTELAEARDEFEKRQEAEEQAEAGAEAVRNQADAVLADLETAQGQHTQFVTQVLGRVDRGLTEADMIADLDPEAAERVRKRAEGLAARIDEIREAQAHEEALEELRRQEEERARQAAELAAQAQELGPATGSLAEVGCGGGGGTITVDSSLAPNLEALIAAAARSGFNLCGNGYRSPEQQVEVRKANCGTTDYAIYEMPSSQCSPPTAPPGASMHEQGLAVDFTCNGTLIPSRGDPCFLWLDANAATFGLFNLPSEPWHWSTNGS